MRTYGRTLVNGKLTWVVVTTAPDGTNNAVFLTTLVQNLRLNLNESPFFANGGIPAKQAVISQTHPDYNVSLTQQRFAPLFASLIVAKLPLTTPTYRISVVTKQGQRLTQDVAA